MTYSEDPLTVDRSIQILQTQMSESIADGEVYGARRKSIRWGEFVDSN